MKRFAAIGLLFISSVAAAQYPRRPRESVDLSAVAAVIRQWGQARAAEGAHVCRFQAVIKLVREADQALDPMQPNVSIEKANEKLAAAVRLLDADEDRRRAAQMKIHLIRGQQIIDPHQSPDIPTQRDRFSREVVVPAAALANEDLIAFVERAQELNAAIQATGDVAGQVSEQVVHAIHGDCAQPPR